MPNQLIAELWDEANSTLRILQWNTEKCLDNAMAPFLCDERVTRYVVITIQEPWINPFYTIMHFPKQAHNHFKLALTNAKGNKDKPQVCIYTRRDLYKYDIFHLSRDILTMCIKPLVTGPDIYIHNVYIPLGRDNLEDNIIIDAL
jgi:hypothetical protein